MKKTAVILALLVNSVFAVFAQTSEPEPQSESNDNVQFLLRKLKTEESKSASLESEINNLKSKIDGLQSENGKLSAKLETAQENLKKEQEAGKGATYKNKIKQLNDTIKSLKAGNAKALKEQQDEAANVQNGLKQEIESLKDQHDKDASSIANLTKELETLNVFKAKWLAQLADDVDAKWLNKGYSAIDLSVLEQDYALYEQFAEWDPKVAVARDKIKILLAEMQIYAEGQRLIASKYDKVRVSEAAGKVKALIAQSKDQTKKEELELLYRKLDDYGITIKIFKKVIDAVDREIRGESSSSGAWPLAKVVIKQQEDDDSIAAIKNIPWLAEQYELYYEALRNNCLGENPARDLIKSLQP